MARRHGSILSSYPSLLMVALVGVMQSGFASAQVYYYQDVEVDVVGIVITVVAYLLSLVLACLCMRDLKNREKTLPENQKCFVGGQLCGYWCLCLICGCCGTGIYYLCARQEIDRRVLMMQNQILIANLPVQTVQQPGGQPAASAPILAQPSI